MSGSRLQPTVLQAALDHIAAGENNAQDHQGTGVCLPCVIKLRLSLGFWGTPYLPRSVRPGRPSTLRQAQRDGLQTYLKSKIGTSLKEMRDFLYSEYDVIITAPSVYRELEKLGWSRKIALKRAEEQSDSLRQFYLANMMQNYTVEQIVVLDGSTRKECTGDRKYD